MNTLLDVGALGVLAATAFLAIGLRGRRVGDHRHCRPCGYDLHGQPESSDRCPECGADLAHPKSTVIGQRQRRSGLVWTGVLLLLVALIPGTLGVMNSTGRINWYRHWPTTWLVRGATASTPDQKALDELQDRLKNKSMTADQAKAMADVVLARQADLDTTWDRQWGDLIETAHLAGLIDTPRWHAYLTHGVVPLVQVRSQINADQPVTLKFTSRRPSRTGRFVDFSTESWFSNLRLDGEKVEGWSHYNHFNSPLVASPNGWATWGPIVIAKPNQLSPGPHRFEVDVKTNYLVASSGPLKAPDVVKQSTVRIDFVVHPIGQAHAQTIVDPALRQAMNNAFSVKVFRTADSLQVRTQVSRLPCKLGHRMYLRMGDREMAAEFSTVLPKQISTDRNYSFRVPVHELRELKTVDLVLRPDEKAIAEEADDEPIWGEEIVFKSVRIGDDPPPKY